jgi:hypothetical protein
MKTPKVFCVGFQKTGTTSMAVALEILGYRVASIFGHEEKDLAALSRDFVPRGLEIAATFDAVQDMPWPLMFRELDQAVPGSKFILTWRDTDRWLSSICGHFGRNPDILQALTYGSDAPFPVGYEAHYRTVYDRHNAAVRAHFRDRPAALLEVNLSEGDGWPKLCGFLEVAVPETPFPTSNTAQSRRKPLIHRIRNRMARLTAV